MKSIKYNSQERVEQEESQETETVAADTQLTTDDNMDSDKKSQTHSGNKRMKHGYIKYISLVILTVQNSALGLSMRYARTRDVPYMFSSSAAVLISEVVKLFICIGLVMQESGNVKKGLQSMYATVILNFKDTIRVGVPSFLYVVQNNLLYLSSSNLNAATYQVTYQLKLLTTAFFAVIVLKRKLKKWQWCALALLAAGVALVQLSSTKESNVVNIEQSKVKGFSAALAACFISGFAGIYFEKVLKESDVSSYLLYHCAVCNISFLRDDLDDHLFWLTHMDELTRAQNNAKHLKTADITQINVFTTEEIVYLNQFKPKLKIHLDVEIVYEDENEKNVSVPKSKVVFFKKHVFKIDWKIWHGLVKYAEDSFSCKMCNRLIPSVDLNDHLKSDEHLEKLDKPFIALDNGLIRGMTSSSYLCIICCSELTSMNAVQSHVQTKKHKFKWNKLIEESREVVSYEGCEEYDGVIM